MCYKFPTFCVFPEACKGVGLSNVAIIRIVTGLIGITHDRYKRDHKSLNQKTIPII